MVRSEGKEEPPCPLLIDAAAGTVARNENRILLEEAKEEGEREQIQKLRRENRRERERERGKRVVSVVDRSRKRAKNWTKSQVYWSKCVLQHCQKWAVTGSLCVCMCVLLVLFSLSLTHWCPYDEQTKRKVACEFTERSKRKAKSAKSERKCYNRERERERERERDCLFVYVFTRQMATGSEQSTCQAKMVMQVPCDADTRRQNNIGNSW